jgi:hypothetical protein
VLGDEHPDVATGLHNLAELYCAQRRYDEAEPLFRRALVIGERVLGPEHAQVVMTRAHYAAMLRETGRADEADRLEGRNQGPGGAGEGGSAGRTAGG